MSARGNKDAQQMQMNNGGGTTADADINGQLHDINTSVEDAGLQSTVKMSKILHVEIKGTMNGFSAMGAVGATWRPVEGKHTSIFGMDSSMSTGMGNESNSVMNADLNVTTNSLRNVTITKVIDFQCSFSPVCAD